MTHTTVYCDYNAGAPLRPEAAEAVARALSLGGNPSSVHGFGRRVKALIEEARERVAAAVDAQAENVVFTSGATEALHLAMDAGLPERASSDAHAGLKARAPSLIVSAVEHDAVFEQAARREAVVAPVDAQGVIDLAALAALLAQAVRPALVAVQLANNETGVIQPVARVAALCREHGALLLVDAAQAFGRMPVSIAHCDATYLVLSSHKIGGPAGAGALVLAPGAPFKTTRFGGGQERGRRPGTENPAAIAGFGVAADIAGKTFGTEAKRVSALSARFEEGLPREAVIFGARCALGRLVNTTNFALPGVAAETAVIAMDLAGVAVSSGAACSSGKVKSSRVLAAMGVSPELAKCALRVSFGWASTEADVDACLAALNQIVARHARAGAA